MTKVMCGGFHKDSLPTYQHLRNRNVFTVVAVNVIALNSITN